MAQQLANRERAAIYEAGAANYEAVLGNAAEAKQRAQAALKLSQGRGSECAAAFALALCGDSSEPRPSA